MSLLSAIIAMPIAILTAIYLVEYGRGRLARAVSFMVDILSGIPSIVAALFIYAAWVTTFGLQRVRVRRASLALAMLMIPVVVRSTEEMLKLVPNELREASYALGVPKWQHHRPGRPADVALRASSPASCSASPASWARPPRCCILGPYSLSSTRTCSAAPWPRCPPSSTTSSAQPLPPDAAHRVWGAA